MSWPVVVADVWRHLFRHPDLGQAVAAVGPRLREELGIASLVVQSIDLQQRSLVVVAEDRASGWSVSPTARRTLSDAQLRALLPWLRGGQPRRGKAGTDELLSLLVDTGQDVDVLAGPLLDEERGPIGVLLLLAASGMLDGKRDGTAAGLLEPFGAALSADRRLHELERLREVVEADNRALLSRLDRQKIVESIVGSDAGFKEVMDRVAQVAATDVPVLLLGETGTGKEVVARAIHDASARRNGPMLRVNCGAIPPGLVDSELFGHERGSFTGALAARAGWFERADGGTLFLDEVGELPLAAQVRLLRVLQESVIERVGGQRSLHVDVRLVAATHRHLEKMVQSGSFREDLWYRINVFPIAIPPLRERREDIPALASHFARSAGKRIGGSPLALSASDVDLLIAYDWPGNVRELAAVIERAVILGNGKRLDIVSALCSRAERGRLGPTPPTGSDPAQFPTLDAAIVRHIEAALDRSRGRIEGPRGAAEMLGINPHTLRSRMRKLGVRWQRFRQAD
ncbi:MAG: sigma-54-dependent Fis family transcriptional regulator [Deltaproteobacteria bacterium]|jgi:hydrogenase-4 transcriptional activator|nr:sigma-54-dependent Fis family transcriptional regulator [Deltaproteobacteria bacterium]